MTTPTQPVGAAAARSRSSCDRSRAVTRSLLGYGVLAGPFYVLVSLAQAMTRRGFDLAHHDWSLLANGSLGWIQIANLVLSGAMVVAAAVGMRRALAGTPGCRWVPRLVAGYGIGLVLAGAFVADPANGFPIGTPAGRAAEVSWHGMLHLAAGGLGFLCLIAACLVYARRLRRLGHRGWALYSALTGVLFLVSFAGITSGSSSAPVVLGFTAGVLLAWAWLAAVSVRLYRATPKPGA
ncbi:hypothetical protein Athai_17710 [Actinocatenispora thailandica]|uniref:DUF998 domain-containing protein n=1 Tax=Actinocatenispora thailandica TaxID=227318 RepID=A0A7R7HWM8_9ACTN|nr:DUF998 domain-containing protein [Actinocatenispora thailandica]BCJ34268.1 hypothetical protein Athai_17710 [Actinocatenispora thailandica]